MEHRLVEGGAGRSFSPVGTRVDGAGRGGAFGRWGHGKAEGQFLPFPILADHFGPNQSVASWGCTTTFPYIGKRGRNLRMIERAPGGAGIKNPADQRGPPDFLNQTSLLKL